LQDSLALAVPLASLRSCIIVAAGRLGSHLLQKLPQLQRCGLCSTHRPDERLYQY
jgi:hypothetical protein